jgi:hypothetical protein
MDIEVIWVAREQKYFCKWGWTAELPEQPVGQISRSGGLSFARMEPTGRAKRAR